MAVTETNRTTAPITDDANDPSAIEVPDALDSAQSKLVYLYLATHGTVTETELCDGLDMKRLALYSVLKTLRRADLIEESGQSISLA